MARCDYTVLPCPNRCNAFQYFTRKDLDNHLKDKCPNRSYTCEDCKLEGTYEFITGEHDEVCPEKIIDCPNEDCGKEMERREIDKHVRDDCDYTKIPCKYKAIGCDKKLIRMDMAEHEEDSKLHLDLAINMTAVMSNVIALYQEEKPISLTFKVQNDDEYTEYHFFTNITTGYHMKITVYPDGYEGGDGTHVSVDIRIEEGINDDDLSWPLQADVTITLLNQLEDKKHFSKTIPVNAEVGDETESPTFIPHTELGLNPAKKIQYLKDDTLYFRVSVKLTKNWLKCSDVNYP